MAKTFDDLVKRTTTPQTRAKAKVLSRRYMKQMLLADLRKYSGKSQKEVALAMGIKQPTLSQLENQDDIQVSTLGRLVRSLGGQLEIAVLFPKGEKHLIKIGASLAAKRQALAKVSK